MCVAMSVYKFTMISKLLTTTMSIGCPLAKMFTMDDNLVEIRVELKSEK